MDLSYNLGLSGLLKFKQFIGHRGQELRSGCGVAAKKPVFQSSEKKSVKEYGDFEIGGLRKTL